MASKSDRMWRLLGRSVAKGQARSRDEVERSTQFDSWASGLDDSDIAQAAKQMRSASLPDLPRFLALAREASTRSLDLRPFNTQLLGAVRLLAGDVIEMATGEGKTLSGAIAAAGFVLHDRRTHVISVNDFLARRDAAWMAPFYELLGLTVGWIDAESSAAERRAAYACDVTYGSVNEIGFDVLRDHLVTDIADLVSPVPDVALIDEADSVLVDEALVPLVLAGDASSDVPTSEVFDAVENLELGVHYETDADNRNVFLTDAGAEKIEADLGGIDLYSEEHVGSTLVQVNVALHAQVLVRKDVHYIVREGRVQLINSSRGRVAQLQRWPDGLQAAVEAKEGVAHTETGEVLDTITVQALIGRYPTVCGMTGTALAAGEQLRKFYGLGVSVIDSNEPMIRIDEPDRVYAHADQKTTAIVDFVSEVHETGQPILIGTQDVAESEALSEELQRASVPVVVLNAKNDAEEADVIAAAGKPGAVTVSTQIAGRGTDIKLGGPDQAERSRVSDLGGLLVIGTGRHTTQRLDNQLRGRAGRQGDPGRSVFFASWEDMVVTNYLDPSEKPGKSDDDGLVTAPSAAHQVDHAQRIAEGSMLEAHSLTWKYNQLTAQHREIVDERRSTLLRTDDALTMLTEHNPDRADELRASLGEAKLSQAAREIVLYHLDRSWSDYLAHLADVRESIHLRALGRQNPLDEFHRIAIDAFGTLVSKATELSQGTFDTVALTDDGIDLASAGMKRPTSTWTYMVHDNPFASSGGEASSIFRP